MNNSSTAAYYVREFMRNNHVETMYMYRFAMYLPMYYLLSDPHSGNIKTHLMDLHNSLFPSSRNVGRHRMQRQGESVVVKRYGSIPNLWGALNRTLDNLLYNEATAKDNMKSQSNGYELSGNQEVMSDAKFYVSGTARNVEIKHIVRSTSFMNYDPYLYRRQESLKKRRSTNSNEKNPNTNHTINAERVNQ
eukprot:270023_1